MPANTEMPEWRSTVVRISSMISTVLPTPAPPNIAALPPVDQRRQQVDDLDAGMEHLAARR